MLLFFWRASLLYMFPGVILLYMRLTDTPFAEIDQGVNNHKWLLIALYCAYVLFWGLANRYLEQLLRRRGLR
ncbi:hypothetical protein [Aeromonas schubertii]|uniref:Uncharacterized protein n=1 Tax=Aeromonas schubertii TaxID=652 RepID=A0A0S2SNB3_9GAMM|nr:hypothetical protein [Aeromonas schubertii]ALP43143.1 hypothetical protein WL1483_3724 [Aeromonas schubertii]KUE81203.1 hypothetical protein ATO46_13045 [Aeromonas schubertii]MBZ6066592.1 hypothetical protein [Aeromonas schubertii]MBZ6073454.1 hypothetical protein [Aeromonas schubertii]QCG49681.1 hypothetical protein E2P79_19290 [Aeromonas schubertii]